MVTFQICTLLLYQEEVQMDGYVLLQRCTKKTKNSRNLVLIKFSLHTTLRINAILTTQRDKKGF